MPQLVDGRAARLAARSWASVPTVVAIVEPPELPAVAGRLGQMISGPGRDLEGRAIGKGDATIGSDGGPVRLATSFGNDRRACRRTRRGG
jgi:hypothetical protein